MCRSIALKNRLFLDTGGQSVAGGIVFRFT
jgi:hypothetical protein